MEETRDRSEMAGGVGSGASVTERRSFVLRHVGDRDVALKPGDWILGRGGELLPMEHDIYLSRKHAKLHVGPKRVTIEDLGSRNGTFIRLKPGVEWLLRNNDRILMGQQVFRFEYLPVSKRTAKEETEETRLFGGRREPGDAVLLNILEDGTHGSTYMLSEAVTHIGRRNGHIILNDNLLSRAHSTILNRDGRYTIVDEGSTNGTFVEIHGVHQLRPGAQFRLGDQFFDLLGPED